jgi:hypothetical protein
MSELPRPLAPWAGQLATLPRDVALSLGPFLRRLSSAIGPLGHPRHSALGEVDGFDGLAHRGSYERLLMSEWLLAEEAPEEFLRRAAAGEHTFLRLARPVPVGSRTSVALFDAGPTQIGSPRLVHIAALIVLARRASAAGARFAWGLLQQPDAELNPDVDAKAVSDLLGGRSASDVTRSDLRLWSKRLDVPGEADDLWLVGGGRLAALAAGHRSSFLVVEDVLAQGRRCVAAVVRQPKRSASEMLLDLPDEENVARVLRAPYGTARVPPSTATGTALSSLLFSTGGNRLYARDADRHLLEYVVPNSPRMKVGAPRGIRIPTPGHVVAIDRLGRGWVAVSSEAGGFHLHARRSVGGCPPGFYALPSQEHYTPPAGVGPLAPCHVLWDPAFRIPEFLFLDGFGTLLRLAQVGGRRVAVVILKNVLHTLRVGTGVVAFVEGPQEVRQLVRIVPGSKTHHRSITGVGSVFLGAPLAESHWGLVAAAMEDGSFHVEGLEGVTSLVLAAGMRVVGVMRNGLRRGEPGLVAIDPRARRLFLVGQAWTKQGPRVSAEIQHLAVSSLRGYVAYGTAAGELGVYSFNQDALVYRGLPLGEAATVQAGSG